MPAVSAAATISTALELALILIGCVLLWRHALSPTARAQPAPAQLAPWTISFADFLIFLWIVVFAGIVFPLIAQPVAGALELDEPTKLILVNTGFQGGMLLGVALYHVFFLRRSLTNRPDTTPPLSATSSPTPTDAPTPTLASAPPTSASVLKATLLSGTATFLMTLPLVFLVGLGWVGLLKLVGLPADPQDSIAFFKNTKSPFLIAAMIVLAAVVAPITEEFIFRWGIFRFTRTRLPRWAALLLPACLFAAVHVHLPSFAPLVVLGIVFSLAFERTGRIGTAIVAHSLFNFYSVLRLFLDPNAT